MAAIVPLKPTESTHLVTVQLGVRFRVEPPPGAEVRRALGHEDWGLGRTSLLWHVGGCCRGAERGRTGTRQGHAEWSRLAHEHRRSWGTGCGCL